MKKYINVEEMEKTCIRAYLIKNHIIHKMYKNYIVSRIFSSIPLKLKNFINFNKDESNSK
jgi:hypothetical protein